jgi:hypothetical protein
MLKDDSKVPYAGHPIVVKVSEAVLAGLDAIAKRPGSQLTRATLVRDALMASYGDTTIFQDAYNAVCNKYNPEPTPQDNPSEQPKEKENTQ